MAFLVPPDDAPELDDLEDDFYCGACDGEGVRLVCVDDICQGMGDCMHGLGGCDGYAVCPCQLTGHPVSG